MANLFVTSDQHWDHAKCLTFELSDGTKMRPEFSCVEEMNEFMVDGWNVVIEKDSDHVYHAGDVAIHKSGLTHVGRCRGKKRLVRGNHDIFPTKAYLPYFPEIYGVRVFEKMIVSHYPLAPTTIQRGWINVHGHCHSNVQQLHFGPRHYNICVEHHKYRPVSIDVIRNDMARLQEQWSNATGISVAEYEDQLFEHRPFGD